MSSPDKIWRIFYADGTTFDNTQGDASEAPKTGIICIKHRNAQHGWILAAFKDFYLWHTDEWWGADEAGYWQFMFAPGTKVVLFGASVPTALFNEIMTRAQNDPDFGNKSAKSPLDYDYKKEWTPET